MLIGGQWIAQYSGTNQGTLVLDVDEIDDHFEAIACAWDDLSFMPSTALYFSTPTRATAQTLENLRLLALDGSGKFLEPAELLEVAKRGIALPQSTNVKFELDNASDKLTVSWNTSIGTHGTATAKRSRAGEPSVLQPLSISYWKSFKEFVSTLDRNKFLFRGQSSNKWRLRTSFHRTGRANLNNFESNDIQQLYRHLSSLTKTMFDLKNAVQNLAFLSFVQHHGYLTPLLDWTKSPYVAAFFAYRSFASKSVNPDDKVRIFKLNGPEWNKVNHGIRALTPVPPSLVLMEAVPLENPRVIPQQSISTISTVDDIEYHIQEAEARTGKKLLEVIDLPATARKEVFSELALMGITAGSLFPGMDGACEALREQNFHLMTRY